jgi:hypothetical protein
LGQSLHHWRGRLHRAWFAPCLRLCRASAAPSYLGMNLRALWIDLGGFDSSHIGAMHSLPLFDLLLEPPPVTVPPATLVTASAFGTMLWGFLIVGTRLAWPMSCAGCLNSMQSARINL